MEDNKEPGAAATFHLPEWETTARHRAQKPQSNGLGGFKARYLDHFNRIMPAHKKYFGLSGKLAIIIIATTSVAILVLIIGLAAGLSHRSRNKALPLGSQTYTGDLTYYAPAQGACGVTSSDNDDIASISHIVFDAASQGSNPNQNPLCRHKLRVLRDGKSIDLTVVDRCVGCKATDLDTRDELGLDPAHPICGMRLLRSVLIHIVGFDVYVWLISITAMDDRSAVSSLARCQWGASARQNTVEVAPVGEAQSHNLLSLALMKYYHRPSFTSAALVIFFSLHFSFSASQIASHEVDAFAPSGSYHIVHCNAKSFTVSQAAYLQALLPSVRRSIQALLQDLSGGITSRHGYAAFFKTNDNLDFVRQIYQDIADGPDVLTYAGLGSQIRPTPPTIICANPNEPDTVLLQKSCNDPVWRADELGHRFPLSAVLPSSKYFQTSRMPAGEPRQQHFRGRR